MDQYKTDESFLARWIAGELSEEERIAFEKTNEYKQFEIINREVQLLDIPDIDTESALLSVNQKIAKERSKKSIKTFRLWYPMVAASVVALIGVFWILTATVTYETAIGEKQEIVLADGSKINLNANSSVSRKRFFWEKNKKVNLIGEAYFTVTKGKGFSVNTSQGVIEVLGTQFNIQERDNSFKVSCYEGEVKYTQHTSNKTEILNKGQQVVIIKATIIKQALKESKQDWLEGKSRFEEVDLNTVLKEIEKYYPITFDSSKIDVKRKFTGSFIHSNLETALQAVLLPMHINYHNEENKYILSK